MNILFQNEFFVAVEKQSGWLTTPGRFADKDPRPVLGLALQMELGRQVFPVHRLDFEVSGVVLYALQAPAHSEMNSLFEGKRVLKTYQALTECRGARPAPGAKFEWKARILRGKKRAFESPHGKPSWTRAHFLELDPNSQDQLRWELHPVTGRSHQLRFDLSRHGFPIVGDELYGARSVSPGQIQLRAVHILFEDPDFCHRWKIPASFQVSPLFK